MSRLTFTTISLRHRLMSGRGTSHSRPSVFFSLQFFFLFLFTVQRNGKIWDNNEILPTPITIIAWLHAVSMDLPDNDSCVFYVLSPLEYSWDMVRHICGYRNRFEFFRYKQVRNSRGSFRSGSPSRSDSLSVPTGVVLHR